jgi:hypothetical protein
VQGEVRHARNGVINLAYQTVGAGPIDLVLVLGFVSHLEASWEEPRLAAFPPPACVVEPATHLRQARLRYVGPDHSTAERSGAPGRLGGGPRCGGLPSLGAVWHLRRGRRGDSLCSAYPDRVNALITFGSFPRALRAPDYPWGWTDQEYVAILDKLQATWLDGAELRNSSLRGDERYRRWFTRYLRLSASPGMLADIMRLNSAGDLRHVLTKVRQPALILHRKQDRWVSVEHARYMASHLPNANLVELEGEITGRGSATPKQFSPKLKAS